MTHQPHRVPGTTGVDHASLQQEATTCQVSEDQEQRVVGGRFVASRFARRGLVIQDRQYFVIQRPEQVFHLGTGDLWSLHRQHLVR